MRASAGQGLKECGLFLMKTVVGLGALAILATTVLP
jgi:hypothetical protein